MDVDESVLVSQILGLVGSEGDHLLEGDDVRSSATMEPELEKCSFANSIRALVIV